MEKNHRVIKLKTDHPGLKLKKIYIPTTFNELLYKIKDYLKNNDQNKIYQIMDVKLKKIIKDENDYKLFILEHSSENSINLFIRLIDKKEINKMPDYQQVSSNLFFQSIIIPKKEEKKINIEEKELTEEEKIKENIRSLVQSKLKTLENNIINEVINNEYPIHKGIICNECRINDIKGIRYKCTICLNYNLCERCEQNTNHDENHIFLKIRKPIIKEIELNKKIISSKLLNNAFIAEPNIFVLNKNKLINLINVTMKNIGNITWKKGFWFKCLNEKSTIFGNDIEVEVEVLPGHSINLEFIYDKEKNNYEQKEFYSSYILTDDKSKQIGNIHIFNIKII